jgi:hypothetical protein
LVKSIISLHTVARVFSKTYYAVKILVDTVIGATDEIQAVEIAKEYYNKNLIMKYEEKKC